jgi:hypothetical protein
MDTWKEFEANELTHSAAHHLLAIHEVGAAYGGWARVSDIARRLNITRGSVSINLRTLKKHGWVAASGRRTTACTGRAKSGGRRSRFGCIQEDVAVRKQRDDQPYRRRSLLH